MGTVAVDRGPRGSGGSDNGGGGGGGHADGGDAALGARGAAAGPRGRHDSARPHRDAHPDRDSRHDPGVGHRDDGPGSLHPSRAYFRAARVHYGAVTGADESTATAGGEQLPHPSEPGLHGANAIAAELDEDRDPRRLDER
jgi:hypothetical protein